MADFPRKRRLRAHGRANVFVRGRTTESAEHVLMKAFLWALYLPTYPALTVEVFIGDKYKPDVVQLDAAGKPTFWGESGHVSPDKIRSLARRYKDTHFAIAKWGGSLTPHLAIIREALDGIERRAPFDVLAFPRDADQHFITPDGDITLTHADIDWLRL